MNGDSFGDRMKRYEEASRTVLPRRIPVIVRVDGRAFRARRSIPAKWAFS